MLVCEWFAIPQARGLTRMDTPEDMAFLCRSAPVLSYDGGEIEDTMEWFRCYHELIHDPKLRRIARELHETPESVIGVWCTLLSAASQSNPRGVLIEYGPEDLGDELNMKLSRAKAFLEAFKKAGILNQFGIVNWEKRQFPSDSSTERMREWRARQSEPRSE